jgi:hypothetical protein
VGRPRVRRVPGDEGDPGVLGEGGGGVGLL